MAVFIDSKQGNFEGEHKYCYAIAHCQVEAENPLRMFVVRDDLLNPKPSETPERMNNRNTFFPARVIMNPMLVTAKMQVVRKVPKREGKPIGDGKFEVEVKMEERELNNRILVEEGCMSFPHRKAIKKERYHTITVRYEYLDKHNKKRLVTEEVEGLKAHIFQHELDHMEGKNIFHG